tara:strand:+ start:112 stop:702 length:591 start_codon:yes stop_codon:yes gene_type:complete
METPPSKRSRPELPITPDSSKDDLKAFCRKKGIRGVKFHTGGVSRRTRKDIYDDIVESLEDVRPKKKARFAEDIKGGESDVGEDAEKAKDTGKSKKNSGTEMDDAGDSDGEDDSDVTGIMADLSQLHPEDSAQGTGGLVDLMEDHERVDANKKSEAVEGISDLLENTALKTNASGALRVELRMVESGRWYEDFIDT